MKTSFYRLIVILLLAVILIGGTVLAFRLFVPDNTRVEIQETTTPEPSNPAPDFTVVDEQGNEVRLSDYLGTPVVLNFWASWCGPCKSEMPAFDEAYRQYGDQVQFLMVNLTDGSYETVETASALIGQEGYSFPVFFDTAMEAANAYQVTSIPMTCVIDERGELLSTHVGAMSQSQLEQEIAAVLPE